MASWYKDDDNSELEELEESNSGRERGPEGTVGGGQADFSLLRRAERLRKRRNRKEKERANFFKDPFKHARQLLEEKKSGKL